MSWARLFHARAWQLHQIIWQSKFNDFRVHESKQQWQNVRSLQYAIRLLVFNLYFGNVITFDCLKLVVAGGVVWILSFERIILKSKDIHFRLNKTILIAKSKPQTVENSKPRRYCDEQFRIFNSSNYLKIKNENDRELEIEAMCILHNAANIPLKYTTFANGIHSIFSMSCKSESIHFADILIVDIYSVRYMVWILYHCIGIRFNQQLLAGKNQS